MKTPICFPKPDQVIDLSQLAHNQELCSYFAAQLYQAHELWNKGENWNDLRDVIRWIRNQYESEALSYNDLLYYLGETLTGDRVYAEEQAILQEDAGWRLGHLAD